MKFPMKNFCIEPRQRFKSTLCQAVVLNCTGWGPCGNQFCGPLKAERQFCGFPAW
jgi:hypothetical protein